jgi:probable rRNA maturation factor
VTRSIYRPPWRIDLDVRDDVRSPVARAGLARTVVAALDEVDAPSPASIGLIVTDDAELAALNAEHMGKRGPTDVLSFPLLPPSAFVRGASAPADPRPPGTRVHLGDIVVSVERAIEQAEAGRGGQTGDVRWSPAEELRLLVTHGVLHICGWDHATPDEEAAMRAVERGLLGAPYAVISGRRSSISTGCGRMLVRKASRRSPPA